jgi:hypothetical protein
MSYDIYCYKSKLGRPDLDEAQSVIEESESAKSDTDNSSKEKIAKALQDYNPKLERFQFDYDEIAKLQSTTVEEAKANFRYIELTKAEGELAVQLTIYDDNVIVTVPYWYDGDKAKQVFNEVNEFTKIIFKTAGYFVYDPQIEKVYDPLTTDFGGLDVYINATIKTQSLRKENQTSDLKNPWWKFW